jgi:hypothetical protein
LRAQRFRPSQATHLPLTGYTGCVPVELNGGNPFLFRLVPQPAATASEGEPVAASQHGLDEAGIA